MFKSITHKSFFVNLLAIVVLVGVLLFIFFNSLGFITNHNETIKIPEVAGKSLAEAEKILEAAGFSVGVQDSVYTDTLPPLTVIRQSPESDEIVKMHRTIFLTINRAVPPVIEMPDLRGFSLKSAEIYLIGLGLKLGDTSFVPDIARNAVKEQSFNGRAIGPGSKVPMGSRIDFVLGSGIGDAEFDVPDLVGLTVSEAKAMLAGMTVGLGAIISTDAVKDTITAFVVKQSPDRFTDPGDGQKYQNKIRPGQMMDIWISNTAPVKDSVDNF